MSGPLPADPAGFGRRHRVQHQRVRNPIDGTFGWSLDAANHNFSQTYTSSAVPEPGTLALTGCVALAGLICRRRKNHPGV